MCTLTYIPHPNGYFFTHNRDERNDRPTSSEIKDSEEEGVKLLFPQDLEAGGTWIALREDGNSACLMNGGSVEHVRRPPYRKSRGLVLLEVLRSGSVQKYLKDHSLDNIEPFTLVIKEGNTLLQLIHDESANQLTEVDPATPHIWSSTTLYTPETRLWREELFRQWLQKDPKTAAREIRRFHLTAGKGDSENDLVMSRWGMLRTLSITQIEINSRVKSMEYFVLEDNTLDRKEIF